MVCDTQAGCPNAGSNERPGLLDLYGSPAFPLPTEPDIEKLASRITNARENGHSGVGFSEVMSGFIHAGQDVGDFEVATKIARSHCESARFFLSVKSWDTSECEKYPLRMPSSFHGC
jgi:hypothetical protein